MKKLRFVFMMPILVASFFMAQGQNINRENKVESRQNNNPEAISQESSPSLQKSDFHDDNSQSSFGFITIGTKKVEENALLTVAGRVHCREIKVTAKAGADFVFEDNYALPNLSDVEEFLKREKHLPEVPTACEMEEDGYDVGAFQVKLLQKIEELTLYTIQQQKRIEELEKLVKNNKK